MTKGIKFILYILGGLVLAYLVFSGGVYSGEKNSPVPLAVPAGQNSGIVNGWWIFLRGKITELGPDYLTMVSENESETANINATSATLCRSQLPDEEIEARLKTNPNLAGYALIFEPIKFSDLKIGDLVQITAMNHENEYLALQISRIIPQKK